MTDQNEGTSQSNVSWMPKLFWGIVLIVLILWISGVFSDGEEPAPVQAEESTEIEPVIEEPVAEQSVEPIEERSIKEPPTKKSSNKNRNVDDDKYYEKTEVPLRLVGGMEALSKNLVYPERAKKDGVEGAVVVIAYINKKGKVERTQIQKGIGSGCDEAAATAVRKCSFIPGQIGGEPVKTKVFITVNFTLDEGEEM